MEPSERVARALWEAADVAGQYPWETLRAGTRANVVGLTKELVGVMIRMVDLQKIGAPEED